MNINEGYYNVKSEEHKFDKLEEELLNIEKFAKNLDLNSKDEYSMVLTNIVEDDQIISKNQSNSDILSINTIKINLNQQIKKLKK